MQEERLARLRKLWLFARAKGNARLMQQIEKDAKKIKEENINAEATFEEAKEIFKA
jgi:hypothetical protein